MKINWKVRLKNKNFWIAIISIVFLIVHRVLAIVGADIDLAAWESLVLEILDYVFIALAAWGIVIDPTTDGTGDSKRALTYEEPHKDEEDI